MTEAEDTRCFELIESTLSKSESLSHAMWLFRQIGKEESLIKREPGSPGLESDSTRFSLSLPWLYPILAT